MLLNKKNLLSVIFIVLLYGISVSQPKKTEYIFPIKPGEVNSLAGTMGELRSSHFHTGLDIKTEGVEGLPVYAAREGYLSRISVSGSGYGLALYLKHPDGNTTVYAHLQRFKDTLATYVLKEQYRRKAFAMNLFFERNEFLIEKGDVIAYSGNSGSSSGPHLHWDLRDPYQRPLNPLKFGFDEIRDSKPPIITKIAFRPMDENARINGLFRRKEVPVYRFNGHYKISGSIQLEGAIGIELLAYDKLDDSYNLCGINYINMRVNEKDYFRCEIDHISFARQRTIYKYYNYPNKLDNGQRFHTLYVDDGNDLPYYDAINRGVINFKNGDERIAIDLTDSYGNTSTLKFDNGKSSTGRLRNVDPEYFINDNLLIINDRFRDPSETLTLHFKNKKMEIPPTVDASHAQYIYNLDKGLPLLATVGEDTISLNFKHRILPGKSYTYFGDPLDVSFDNNSLFDTLYFQYHHEINFEEKEEIFYIGNKYLPLKRSIKITLKPEFTYDHSKYAVYGVDDNGSLYFNTTKWENNRAIFETSSFGNFVFAADEQGPVITPLQVSSERVRFRITDDISGIQSFDASINGEWLLMRYDPKTATISSERLDKSKTIQGEFELIVKDNQNNVTTFNQNIN